MDAIFSLLTLFLSINCVESINLSEKLLALGWKNIDIFPDNSLAKNDLKSFFEHDIKCKFHAKDPESNLVIFSQGNLTRLQTLLSGRTSGSTLIIDKKYNYNFYKVWNKYLKIYFL